MYAFVIQVSSYLGRFGLETILNVMKYREDLRIPAARRQPQLQGMQPAATAWISTKASRGWVHPFHGRLGNGLDERLPQPYRDVADSMFAGAPCKAALPQAILCAIGPSDKAFHSVRLTCGISACLIARTHNTVQYNDCN